MRHWPLVFVAFTFLMYQRLTGGLKHWHAKPLKTFGDSFKAFRHAVETIMLLVWIPENLGVFRAHRASLGFKMA